MGVNEIIPMVAMICSAIAAVLSFVAQFITGKQKSAVERWQKIMESIQGLCVKAEGMSVSGSSKKLYVMSKIDSEYGVDAKERAKISDAIDIFIDNTKEINFTEQTERG